MSWPGAFGALGEPARLRTLSLLASAPDGEIGVCDLVEPLGRSQATIPRHLKILSDAGLITRAGAAAVSRASRRPRAARRAPARLGVAVVARWL